MEGRLKRRMGRNGNAESETVELTESERRGGQREDEDEMPQKHIRTDVAEERDRGREKLGVRRS